MKVGSAALSKWILAIVFAAGIVLVVAPGPRSARAVPPPQVDPGSLVRTTMQSEVGVVLDEIPASMRSRVAAALLARPAAFWTERARAQIRLTIYRLVFREAFYSQRRQQLPLPPESLWNIRLVGAPQRHLVNGHDVVGVRYEFSSVLLSDFESPAVSEPQLNNVGGTWSEPFTLPVDPELLFQRTGYACMDEDQFPFNSVDSEEVDSFYDETAVVEKVLSNEGHYHFTRQPTESCVQALQNHVGAVTTSLLFERLPWNPAVANAYRFGQGDRGGARSRDLPARLPAEPDDLSLRPLPGERRLRGRGGVGRRHGLAAPAPVRHVGRKRRQPGAHDRRRRLQPQRRSG